MLLTMITLRVSVQPSVSVSSTSLTFQKGQREPINCTVVGSPAATTVQWFKNGAVLDLSSGGFQSGTVAQPSLTFTSVKVTDKGSYVCSATNSKGQTNSSAIAVTVLREYIYERIYPILCWRPIYGMLFEKTCKDM